VSSGSRTVHGIEEEETTYIEVKLEAVHPCDGFLRHQETAGHSFGVSRYGQSRLNNPRGTVEVPEQATLWWSRNEPKIIASVSLTEVDRVGP
jgi:hypothetical protein